VPLVAAASIVALIDALAPELFPWSWGNGIAAEPHLRQLAAIGSVYLVSFFAVLSAAIVLGALLRSRAGINPAFHWGPAVLSAALVLCALVFRYWPDSVPAVPPLRVAIAQTNIGPAGSAKSSDEDFAREAINRLFGQSVDALQLHAPLQLILWPEASMPFHSASPGSANRAIYSVTFDGALEYLRRRGHVAVIYHDMYHDRNALRSRFAARGANASEIQYFKQRLVPWGEYLPFGGRRWFPEAGNFTPASGRRQVLELPLMAESERLTYSQIGPELDLVQQPGSLRQNFPLPIAQRVLKIQPLLCYEALYPADAQTKAADVIINLASDAWFGDGFEGAQHASATMLRAVENGRPMLRAAMSGISFAVDNRGDDLVRRTGQGRAETLLAEVPLSARAEPHFRFWESQPFMR
jgi:apolipoprotein N-acyltransferase